MSWYRDEYLKSEDWKNLRNAILIYQDHICESCGEPAKDVHHLVYRKIWDVKSLDLMALCRPCHTAVHDWLETEEAKQVKIRAKTGVKGGKVGMRIRNQIARWVSPRGMVVYKCCFGKTHFRITCYAEKEKRNMSEILGHRAKPKRSKRHLFLMPNKKLEDYFKGVPKNSFVDTSS